MGEANTIDPTCSLSSLPAGLPCPDVRSVVPSYDPRPTNARSTSTAITCWYESKWLLVCAQTWHRPTSLLHLNVCSTTSDQQLFTELRQLYVSLKKAWWHRLSLKVVQSIRYVQVSDAIILSHGPAAIYYVDNISSNYIQGTLSTCAKSWTCLQIPERKSTCIRRAILSHPSART